MGTLSLSDAQQRAYGILLRVQGGKLAPLDAAELLCCTPRHIRRQVARLTAEEMAVVVHGNTGRKPINKTDQATHEQIKTLLSEPRKDNVWHQLNVCHLQEKLAEKESIMIGRSTLDRLLVESGLHRRGKEAAPRRARRPPVAAKGMMIQIDGSLHRWFQGRGPAACLMAGIDDASGELLYAHFQRTEDQAGYLRMIHHIAVNFGLPMSYYHDKHTILRSPAKMSIEDELAGREPMSQVQRVLHDLGVESIAANSPQAKGRVERLFKTLQDRLVNEMAFEGISTCEEANEFLVSYLPKHNSRFARQPKDPEPAWVALDGADMFYHCSVMETRSVNKGQTISWHGRTLQILGTQNLAGKTVEARTDYTGELRIYSFKVSYEYREIEKPAKQQTARKPEKQIAAPQKVSAEAEPKQWLYGRNKSLTREVVDLIAAARALEARPHEVGHNR